MNKFNSMEYNYDDYSDKRYYESLRELNEVVLTCCLHKGSS